MATFYALYATKPRPPVVAHVCDDIACRLAGAEEICADLDAGGRRRRRAGTRRARSAGCARPCLGLCDLAPAAMITAAGETPVTVRHRRRSTPPGRSPRLEAVAVRRAGADDLVRSAVRPARTCTAPRVGSAWSTRPRWTTIGPTVATRPAPGDRDRARGGHRRGHRLEARRAAAARHSRPVASGPPWPTQPAQPHYLVCNADESEPGTFKDRVLLEGDPFAVIEAMTIAGLRDGASAATSTSAASIPRPRRALPTPSTRRPRGRPARAGHPRLRLRLRHRAPARRRRLHLRRGDGALRIDRGQARRAAQQAAVPGRGRAVRQADRRQQRRDPGQRAAHPARWAAQAYARDRHRGLDRPEALLPVRPRRAAGRPTRWSSGRRCAT